MQNNHDVILRVENLRQHFKTGVGKYRIYNRAVDGVSFEIRRGEVFSLVGESGCGKTTTARSIIKLYKPTDGEVFFLNHRVTGGTMTLRENIKKAKIEASQKIKEVKADTSLLKEDKTKRIQEIKAERRAKVLEYTREIRSIEEDMKKEYIVEENEQLSRELEQKMDHVKETMDSRREDLKGADATDKARIKQELRDLKDELLNLQAELKLNNKPLMNQMQMVFQDPIDSLNPRMSVKDIIAESLYINGVKRDQVVLNKVYEVLEMVGLQRNHADHYPHEFSGGQRQRVGIARAIISKPKLIIADEPISALDVSIQAQVINLLNDLRLKLGLTILFVAHDLSVVKFLSDRLAIMYYGKIVEIGSKEKIFKNPLHPYTKSLLSANPMPDPNYEKARKDSIKYDPRMHDYSVEKPRLQRVEEDHYIYASDTEFKQYLKELK